MCSEDLFVLLVMMTFILTGNMSYITYEPAFHQEKFDCILRGYVSVGCSRRTHLRKNKLYTDSNTGRQEHMTRVDNILSFFDNIKYKN